MLGYNNAKLGLVNELYSSSVNVEFIQIEESLIVDLIFALKHLKNTVETYYEYDEILNMETELFIKQCRRVVGSTLNYKSYFEGINDLIIKYFTFTKRKIYTDLFKQNIEPIIDIIKVLRKKDNNAYIDTINKMVYREQIVIENSYLLTKTKVTNEYFEINKSKLKIMHEREFIDNAVYAEYLIFLGTPSYFDRIFSEIFYGKNIFFLGYSCFENRLVKKSSFSNLISQKNLINTIYENINLEKGFAGIDLNTSFFMKNEKKSEDAVIIQYENENVNSEEKLEVKLATISNNNYIFLPVRQKVNVINRDSLKITQEKVSDLSIGDLLVFRTQNAISLVREVADSLMGVNAEKYRELIDKWKKRLRFNVEKKGVEKVSKILRKRYGIEMARENNIKNWLSNYSIKPRCLEELLKALKFEEQEVKAMMNASSKINSAHISAGHQISQTLMNELDENLESIIDDKGYYIFQSNEFAGTLFNIEEIKKISKKTYFISEKETLKIIKG